MLTFEETIVYIVSSIQLCRLFSRRQDLAVLDVVAKWSVISPIWLHLRGLWSYRDDRVTSIVSDMKETDTFTVYRTAKAAYAGENG